MRVIEYWRKGRGREENKPIPLPSGMRAPYARGFFLRPRAWGKRKKVEEK